jgi:hypothetical protein
MNYLILTPDGVGSTILQRLITMTLYLENDAVINTHELTNGLKLENNFATKDFDLRYSQTLVEIANILQESQTETSLVSRLAKYHLDNRKDPTEDTHPFYEFLNSFFTKKIMCVRKNIFEYAMSWSIRDRSGVLNVYDKQDRYKVLRVSEVDESYFIEKCQEYVKYIEWTETNFPEAQQISYEDMMINSDRVMEELTGYKETFSKKFGMPLTSLIKTEYEYFNSRTKDQYQNTLADEDAKALVKYRYACNKMIEQNIIMNVPLKNTTLIDKKKQIKNFDKCLGKFYNFAKNHNWIDQSTATYDFWNEQHIC